MANQSSNTENKNKQGAGKSSGSSILTHTSSFWKVKEALYNGGVFSSGIIILIIIIAVVVAIFVAALPSILHNGLDFFTGLKWVPNEDPERAHYGALPVIVGTLSTSALALVMSFPFSLAIALLLGEYFRKGTFSSIFKTLTEILAGIPSVIYGFWGFYTISFLIQKLKITFGIETTWGRLSGTTVITAAIVLAIMIIPYTASIAREVIDLVPRDLKEAAYALGATRSEVIFTVVIPYARSGILAGLMLALGRAIGETMAVTMVIGSVRKFPDKIMEYLFESQDTIASTIASQWGEAVADKLHFSALVELGLVLFVITAIINFAGRWIIKKMSVGG